MYADDASISIAASSLPELESALNTELQPVAKVVETSYLNVRQLHRSIGRNLSPLPPFPTLLAKQHDVQNLDEQH